MAESIALITGALTGIGRATAVILHNKGRTLLCPGVAKKKDRI